MDRPRKQKPVLRRLRHPHCQSDGPLSEVAHTLTEEMRGVAGSCTRRRAEPAGTMALVCCSPVAVYEEHGEEILSEVFRPLRVPCRRVRA